MFVTKALLKMFLSKINFKTEENFHNLSRITQRSRDRILQMRILAFLSVSKGTRTVFGYSRTFTQQVTTETENTHVRKEQMRRKHFLKTRPLVLEISYKFSARTLKRTHAVDLIC